MGIPSFCTANRLALEAVILYAARSGAPTLIEATANQVNQYGGYTGMKAADFKGLIRSIEAEYCCAAGTVILGGDHLGPLPWKDEPAEKAMEKAQALVAEYAAAGFSKLHLDTSMRLGGDDPDTALSVEVVAERGAALASAAMKAWRGEGRPALVIGSEVPIPGGVYEAQSALTPTSAESFVETVEVYRKAFEKVGLDFSAIAAVVVQPGVEFSGDGIHEFSIHGAAPLYRTLLQYPELMFEGHSTDYQPLSALEALTKSGVGILKTGPELTFAAREALFGLSYIEEYLFPPERRSGFVPALERAMLDNPEDWRNHYSGSDDDLRIARMFSLSDRCRYYMNTPEVLTAQEHLFANIDSVDIPPGLLRQFLPGRGSPITPKSMRIPAKTLVLNHIIENAVERYHLAAGTALM